MARIGHGWSDRGRLKLVNKEQLLLVAGAVNNALPHSFEKFGEGFDEEADSISGQLVRDFINRCKRPIRPAFALAGICLSPTRRSGGF